MAIYEDPFIVWNDEYAEDGYQFDAFKGKLLKSTLFDNKLAV
jgi:hypothetical protein